MWKRTIKYALPLIICIVFLVTLIPGCKEEATTTPPVTSPTASPTPTPPAQNEIVIGASRDITGPMAAFQFFGFAAIYKMWAAEVNAAGGINVAGKKLPVRIIEYDDGSDTARTASNIEKLCTQDHVDFLFGPTGTTALFAAAPIANKYKTLIICGEGGATTLEPKLADLPYVFSVLNYSNHFQLPVFAQIMEDAGAKTAYIAYIENLHGTEYRLVGETEFGLHGITVLGSAAFPITIADMEPIIKAAQALNPDIFFMSGYPDNNVLFMKTAIALNYSPKAILMGPGCNFGFFPLTFGPPDYPANTLQGVFGEGAWNTKSSAAAAAFAVKAEPAVGGPANMDWWGAIDYYAALQFFQQAIEQAASLDNDKVRAVMTTAHFNTALGEMWWDVYGGGKGGGLLPQECYAGQIGQWQNGIFEVVDPGAKRTADPIYPKPAWPAP
jgi:branched-chain amino acid transport system substrate-binding protein